MKNIYKFGLIILCCFTSNLLLSQFPAFDYLDINNINARINANANHFWDSQNITLNFEVPKNSGKHTIFNNTFWIGGFDDSNELHLSAEIYMQTGNDFTTGPLSVCGAALTDPATIAAWNRIWSVTTAEIDSFLYCFNHPSSCVGYVIPNSIMEWPAHGDTTLSQSFNLAPFIDVDNDGVYNPLNGDYPDIRGDKALFFIFNDNGIPNTESGGNPLGIEVHAMAYAFDCPQDEAFDHTIFMHYKIFNRSNKNYSNTYIGLYTDLSLGDPYDDYIASDVSRGSYYAYNGREIDGDGAPHHYGLLPPAQAVTILAGPYKDADGLDNPKYDSLGNQLCDESINGFNFGDGIIDNERLGMTGFVYFGPMGSGVTPPMYIPETAPEYYNYLVGLWRDSTNILYGGNGHYTTGAYGPACRFMYPGDSDTCNWGTGGLPPNGPVYWTEETAGNQPFDRRGFGSSGPFTFEAGTMQELDFAFVFGRTTDTTISSVEIMKNNIDVIKQAFVDNMTPCGTGIYTGSHIHKKENISIVLYPNPASETITIDLNIEREENLILNVYDIWGRHRMSYDKKRLNSGNNSIKLEKNQLENGLYFFVISIGSHVETKRVVVMK